MSDTTFAAYSVRRYRINRNCCKLSSICKSVCKRVISRYRNVIFLWVFNFLRYFSVIVFRFLYIFFRF